MQQSEEGIRQEREQLARERAEMAREKAKIARERVEYMEKMLVVESRLQSFFGDDQPCNDLFSTNHPREPRDPSGGGASSTAPCV